MFVRFADKWFLAFRPVLRYGTFGAAPGWRRAAGRDRLFRGV